MRPSRWVPAVLLLVVGACGGGDSAEVSAAPTPGGDAASSTTTTGVATTISTPSDSTSTTNAAADGGADVWAAELGAAESCQDVAEVLVTIEQATLDGLAGVEVDETSSRADVYDLAFELRSNLIADVDEQLEEAADRLGCHGYYTTVLICQGRESLEPHGEAEQIFLEYLSESCPAPVDESSVAEAGLGKTIGLPMLWTMPTDLDAGADALWVADFGAGRLLRVDPTLASVVGRTPEVGAWGVVVAEDAVWFTSIDGNRVHHVDLAFTEGDSVEVGNSPTGVASGANSIWVINNDDHTVSRIDAETYAVINVIPVGTAGFGFPEFAHDALWVPDTHQGVVHQIDPKTNRAAAAPGEVGSAPMRIASDERAVWVVSNDGVLTSLDPISGQTTSSSRVGLTGWGVAADGDSVCVAADNRVIRVDPETLDITPLAVVPGTPVDVTYLDGVCWVLWSADGDMSYVSEVPGS